MLAEMEITKTRDMDNMGTVFLDPEQKSPRAQDFEERLTARIVGQERAVRRMSGLYQIFLARMNPPNRPIGTMLFLGPTGSGKTRVIEAAAEVLYGDSNAIVKIDCGEFQHSHEIAKLMLEQAGTFLERTEAVRVAISLGMSLSDIEAYLDWLDSTRGSPPPEKGESTGEN